MALSFVSLPFAFVEVLVGIHATDGVSSPEVAPDQRGTDSSCLWPAPKKIQKSLVTTPGNTSDSAKVGNNVQKEEPAVSDQGGEIQRPPKMPRTDCASTCFDARGPVPMLTSVAPCSTTGPFHEDSSWITQETKPSPKFHYR